MGPRPRLSLCCLAASCALAACRCDAPLVPLEPGQLVATPSQLNLDAAYVGQPVVGVVEFVNQGGAPLTATVDLTAPFLTDSVNLVLARGAAASVVVHFTPTTPGMVNGLLTVGTLEVPVRAEGLAVPSCPAAGACVAASFDAQAGLCRETLLPDGAGCETNCLLGACSAGTCLGHLKGCDDSDACTVDACDEASGCRHQRITCPAPTAPCQVPSCDQATGCGAQLAPDGTLCGPDDCAAITVSVCVTGQCVTRARPATGRCANQWVPTTLTARWTPAMAYDPVHQRSLLVGGAAAAGDQGDTWQWDGAFWQQRFPADSAPALQGHAVTWDSDRQRLVLFGGTTFSGAASFTHNDTWEWDDITWVQRLTALAPPPRQGHRLVYDSSRHRALLFGGRSYTTLLSDCWEWDGTQWAALTPAIAPSAREDFSMAFDEHRNRVVLFGGRDDRGATLADTWEWDGRTWTLAAPTGQPPPRAGAGLGWDGARGTLVLFGGVGLSLLADTWTYDGLEWRAQHPPSAPPARHGHGMTFDAARGRVVLFGGSSGALLADTWEWDGLDWRAVGPAAPPPRIDHAVSWDSARQELVLFGGRTGTVGVPLADTWVWNGTTWTQRFPASSPSARTAPLLAWDEGRARVVLVGGLDQSSAVLHDTWEWDGTTWSLRSAAAPAVSIGWGTMAFHGPSGATVLVLTGSDGGTSAVADTWLWDGGAWAQARPTHSPAPAGALSPSAGVAGQLLLISPSTAFFTSLTAEQWAWDGRDWTPQVPPALPFERAPVALAWDSARQRVVLFGGGGMLISALTAETWEWDGTAWWQRLPTHSPPAPWRGQYGQMAYDAARARMTLYDGADTWRLLP